MRTLKYCIGFMVILALGFLLGLTASKPEKHKDQYRIVEKELSLNPGSEVSHDNLISFKLNGIIQGIMCGNTTETAFVTIRYIEKVVE